MPSIREQVLQEVHTRRSAIPDFSHYRNPDVEPREEDLPATIQDDGGETVLGSLAHGVDRYELQFVITIMVVEIEGQALETTLDDAFVLVVRTLVADPTLGGLAEHVARGDVSEPGYERAEGGRSQAQVEVAFTVTFSAAEDDPSVLAP